MVNAISFSGPKVDADTDGFALWEGDCDDLDPAVSLVEEVEVTPAMIERISEGTNLKIQDQVWILMQACSKFIDVLDAVPEEHRASIDTELLSDAVSMVLVAAPGNERDKLRGYITGETDGYELDGPGEEEPVAQVQDT